jgi:hypothetical protein
MSKTACSKSVFLLMRARRAPPLRPGAIARARPPSAAPRAQAVGGLAPAAGPAFRSK